MPTEFNPKKYPFLWVMKNQQEPFKDFAVPLEVVEKMAVESGKLDELNYLFKTEEGQRLCAIMHLVSLGSITLQAQLNFNSGRKSRDETLKDLGNIILPQTQGGAFLGSACSSGQTIDFIKQILKSTYLEMKDCVRELRGLLNLPKKRIAGIDELTYFLQYSLWEKPREEIIENFPIICELFKPHEIDRVIMNAAISDISYLIIAKRVNLSPRSLKNILTGVSPIQY